MGNVRKVFELSMYSLKMALSCCNIPAYSDHNIWYRWIYLVQSTKVVSCYICSTRL